MIDYVRAALAGAATGGRTFTGLAGLALTTPPKATAQPDKSLANPWVAGTITLLAAQEWVMDKLPQAPSRLDPPGLPMRGVSAAAAGVVIARREFDPAETEALRPGPAGELEPVATEVPAARSSPVRTAACVGVAVAAALGASWLGATARGWAADRIGRDWVGAVFEDLLSAGLAFTAARPATASRQSAAVR